MDLLEIIKGAGLQMTGSLLTKATGRPSLNAAEGVRPLALRTALSDSSEDGI